MTASQSQPVTPPRKRLSESPQCQSLNDVETALHEMSYIASLKSTVKASVAQQCELVKLDGEKRLVIPVAGEKVSVHPRAKELESAVASYCNDHRDEILDGLKTKSRKLTHGTLAWKKQPKHIGFTDDAAPEQLAEKIDKAADEKTAGGGGLRGALMRSLKRIPIGQITLADLLNVTFEVDKARLLALVKDGLLQPEDLAALGLEVVQPPEKFSARPHQYTVEPRTSA